MLLPLCVVRLSVSALRQFCRRAMSPFLPLSFQSSVDHTPLQFCKFCRKAESLFLQTLLLQCGVHFVSSAEELSALLLPLSFQGCVQFCRLSVLLSRQMAALSTVGQFCSLSVLQQSRADHQVRSECCYHCSFIVVLESNDWGHNRTWNARSASVKISPIQVFIGYKTLIEPC